MSDQELWEDDTPPYKLQIKSRLTQKEFESLCRKAQIGDIKARNDIVEANIALVTSIATKYKCNRVPVEDLVQEGIFGLIEAIDKFDLSLGLQFSTYATFWIFGKVQRAYFKYSNLISMPVRAHQVSSSFEDFVQEFQEKHGDVPTIKDVAQEFSVSRYIAEALLEERGDVMSLDTPPEGTSFEQRDLEDTESAVMHKLDHEELINLIYELDDEKERQVILYRFGLLDGQVRTLKEVSEILDINSEGIRQSERSALEKLRGFIALHEF